MPARNLLLAALPLEVHDRLARYMRTVDLAHGKVLNRPNEIIDTVYFPLDCLISVTITLLEGRTVEVGAVGNREMVGINAFMGREETSQTEYITQAPGAAVSMAAEPLLAEFDSVKPVRDVMLRYTQAYIAQLSQNVACNRVHTIEQRLARWLLEVRDRLGTEDLSLSHEFVSQMLGVRRAGISETAAALQDKGLIEYGRKNLRIINSPGLERVACECFKVLRQEYDRLLDPMVKANAKPADE